MFWALLFFFKKIILVVPGSLYEAYKSYNVPFWLAGVFLFISSAISFMVPLVRRYEQRRLSKKSGKFHFAQFSEHFNFSVCFFCSFVSNISIFFFRFTISCNSCHWTQVNKRSWRSWRRRTCPEWSRRKPRPKPVRSKSRNNFFSHRTSQRRLCILLKTEKETKGDSMNKF